ncbi:MAG: UDP-N-acetylmuramoyl-L-alanyl-D-glutamate--2,6-diaminopimelate ligase [Gammaproteobacteria bacterium]|nr:UDP-N-acetylmuramoyl-L-alanyl-D-glutamate--2,6-diaminopimelate ligase [Gammaproteobacteria bacterium]
MTEISLQQLLTASININININVDISICHLTNDSRNVSAGSLFFAYPGVNSDGRDYIAAAIKAGATAILYEADTTFSSPKVEVPCIAVTDLASQQGAIAACFYGYPSRDITVIAVTGTNGKTSVTHFIAQALAHCQLDCAVIGTNGMGLLTELESNPLTTPDPIKLQAYFSELKSRGIKYVACEASSHALAQGRLNGLAIDVGVFTNLTQDHLDYHHNMQQYGAAKLKLFTAFKLKQAIINFDDQFSKEILAKTTAKNITGYALQPERSTNNCLSALKVTVLAEGFSVTVDTPQGQGKFKTALLGSFNISNLLAVLTTLLALEIPLPKALSALSTLQPVIGRMQQFGNAKTPQVIIDYAHTPDALAQALQALKAHCQGELWCVFGCGGERDRTKRSKMGAIAADLCQHLVITNDNPRGEDPAQIIADITQGAVAAEALQIQPDRALAIALAVQSAKLNDMVLVAGKGHETYQIIGTETVNFSDSEHVTKQLNQIAKGKVCNLPK